MDIEHFEDAWNNLKLRQTTLFIRWKKTQTSEYLQWPLLSQSVSATAPKT